MSRIQPISADAQQRLDDEATERVIRVGRAHRDFLDSIFASASKPTPKRQPDLKVVR